MNGWTAEKSAQVCIRVPDVDVWYAAYEGEEKLDGLSDLFVNDEIDIRAFVFENSEGYQIEFQAATRLGA